MELDIILLLLLLVPPPPPPPPILGLGFLVDGLSMFIAIGPLDIATGVFNGVKLLKNVLSRVLSNIYSENKMNYKF